MNTSSISSTTSLITEVASGLKNRPEANPNFSISCPKTARRPPELENFARLPKKPEFGHPGVTGISGMGSPSGIGSFRIGRAREFRAIDPNITHYFQYFNNGIAFFSSVGHIILTQFIKLTKISRFQLFVYKISYI